MWDIDVDKNSSWVIYIASYTLLKKSFLSWVILIIFISVISFLLIPIWFCSLPKLNVWCIQNIPRWILYDLCLIGSSGYECKVEIDDSGLSWDVVCFTFLLLQLRIYNSHYFRHIIASAEAQNVLAARSVSYREVSSWHFKLQWYNKYIDLISQCSIIMMHALYMPLPPSLGKTHKFSKFLCIVSNPFTILIINSWFVILQYMWIKII